MFESNDWSSKIVENDLCNTIFFVELGRKRLSFSKVIYVIPDNSMHHYNELIIFAFPLVLFSFLLFSANVQLHRRKLKNSPLFTERDELKIVVSSAIIFDTEGHHNLRRLYSVTRAMSGRKGLVYDDVVLGKILKTLSSHCPRLALIMKNWSPPRRRVSAPCLGRSRLLRRTKSGFAIFYSQNAASFA